LRDKGLDRDEAEILVQHAASNCKPPFDETEAGRKVTSAWSYEERKTLELEQARQEGEEIDGATLLDAIEGFISRFVTFPSEHEVVAVALWVAHTHAIDAADQSPYLAITSPEKQSGKSRLLDALELLSARPWSVISPSEAVLFRKIDLHSPTLLLDEVDAIFGKRAEQTEGLRAMLNASNRRGKPIPRCVGPKHELKDFEIFGAKALAGIGRLPDTVGDRSIPVRMQRRKKGESVARFRRREVEPEASELHVLLEAWAVARVDELRAARPDLPEALNDRAQDSWEPLLAIADAAGGPWPKRARGAAVQLHNEANDDDESLGVLLLTHIREAFEWNQATGQFQHDRLHTSELLKRLIDNDEGPWAQWWAQDVKSDETKGPAAKLARLLRPFKIKSKKLKINSTALQGFERESFTEAWERYLPSGGSEPRNPAGQGPVTRIPEEKPQEPLTPSDQEGSDVPTPNTEPGDDGVAADGEPEQDFASSSPIDACGCGKCVECWVNGHDPEG